MTDNQRCLLIFDMDGTLYSSPPLGRAYGDLAADLVARRLKVDRENGRMRLREEQDRLTRGLGEGATATVSSALDALGIDLDTWIDARDEEIDPSPMVARDEALRRRLEILRRHFELAIVTNNSRPHAEAITRSLGVREFFGDRIFTVSESRLLKPDPEVFRQVLDTLDYEPSDCVAVGDRYSVDVAPAETLGMRGITIDSADEIYGVLDRLWDEANARDEVKD